MCDASVTNDELKAIKQELVVQKILSQTSSYKLLGHALAEPARLAAARAEGVREGIEMAKIAVREARIDVPGPDVSVDYLCGVNRGASQMKDAIKSALGAISPPPAEPTGGTAEPGDWTVSDTELARDILSYLGIGSDASLEPGDRRRDRIAAMICADRERRIVNPAKPSAPVAEDRMAHAKAVQDAGIRRYLKKRIAALEAENAKLWERNEKLAEALRPLAAESERRDSLAPNPDIDHWPIGGNYLTYGDLRRARALIQGGSDAG